MQVKGTDYKTPDGTCVRDYIDVTDLVDAHVKALNKAAPGKVGIYNVGTGKGIINLLLCVIVWSILGSKITIVKPFSLWVCGNEQADQWRSLLRHVKRQLGWTSKLNTLPVGLVTMLKFSATQVRSTMNWTGQLNTPIFKRVWGLRGGGRRHTAMDMEQPPWLWLLDAFYTTILHQKTNADPLPPRVLILAQMRALSWSFILFSFLFDKGGVVGSHIAHLLLELEEKISWIIKSQSLVAFSWHLSFVPFFLVYICKQ